MSKPKRSLKSDLKKAFIITVVIFIVGFALVTFDPKFLSSVLLLLIIGAAVYWNRRKPAVYTTKGKKEI